jgi:hypothetical protein
MGKEGVTMSRNIILALMTLAVMLAGCQGESTGEFVHEHKVGLIGGGIGAGIGALAGHAVGHNTTSTLLGAAVGGGIGYLIGNTQDKKRAEQYNPAQPTALTGTQWKVQQLNMPNPPSYREMYLTFAPNSQLVTTQVLPDGQVITAAERYRIADHTLIINRPAESGQPGYIINANYNLSGDTMTISSPEFSANLVRAPQVPSGSATL